MRVVTAWSNVSGTAGREPVSRKAALHTYVCSYPIKSLSITSTLRLSDTISQSLSPLPSTICSSAPLDNTRYHQNLTRLSAVISLLPAISFAVMVCCSTSRTGYHCTVSGESNVSTGCGDDESDTIMTLLIL